MKYFFKLLKYLLIIAILSYAASFYFKDKLIGLSDGFQAATLKDPVQAAVKSSYKIAFQSNNYDYVVNPIADYKITGIVVSKIDYAPTITVPEQVMRYGLCVVWGKNVSDKRYVSSSITYGQNQRFCTYSTSGGDSLYSDQISNNRIVTTNSAILDKIKAIKLGDEVAITGQLIRLSSSGAPNDYSETKIYDWTSSLNRKDTGTGAIEMIYAESVDVLTPAHAIDMRVNEYSLWAIIGISALFVLRFLFLILFLRPKKTSAQI